MNGEPEDREGETQGHGDRETQRRRGTKTKRDPPTHTQGETKRYKDAEICEEMAIKGLSQRSPQRRCPHCPSPPPRSILSPVGGGRRKLFPRRPKGGVGQGDGVQGLANAEGSATSLVRPPPPTHKAPDPQVGAAVSSPLHPSWGPSLSTCMTQGKYLPFLGITFPVCKVRGRIRVLLTGRCEGTLCRYSPAGHGHSPCGQTETREDKGLSEATQRCGDHPQERRALHSLGLGVTRFWEGVCALPSSI